MMSTTFIAFFKICSIAFFALLQCFVIGQNSKEDNILKIQSSKDDFGGYLTPINGNYFLVTISRGGESVPNPDYTNAYYDFTDITYLVSDELELIDSLHYNTIEGYGTRIAHIHRCWMAIIWLWVSPTIL